MPIKPNPGMPPKPRIDIYAPDIHPGDVIETPPTFTQEEPIRIPANFDDLPLEEQQRVAARVRFTGFRCRADLKDEIIPRSKETLEL